MWFIQRRPMRNCRSEAVTTSLWIKWLSRVASSTQSLTYKIVNFLQFDAQRCGVIVHVISIARPVDEEASKL
jgi:hypothetical protein